MEKEKAKANCARERKRKEKRQEECENQWNMEAWCCWVLEGAMLRPLYIAPIFSYQCPMFSAPVKPRTGHITGSVLQ